MRKIGHVLGVMALSLLMLLGGLAVSGAWHNQPPAAQASPLAVVHYISSVSGQDSGDCADSLSPCRTIQYAIDQAVDGDEIRIAAYDNATPAIYTGSNASGVVVLSRSLTLQGGYVYIHAATATWQIGLAPAVVDGEHARRAISITGPSTPTLRLLSLVNGQAGQGGNLYAENAQLSLAAVSVMSGSATYGGGMYLKDCQNSLDLTVLLSGAGYSGAVPSALSLSGLLIVQYNTAQYGGGVYVEGGNPLLSGVSIYSNTATSSGGGLYALAGRPVVVAGLVQDNQAGSGGGGGLYLENSAAIVAVTSILSNSTTGHGGGLYLNGPLTLNPTDVPLLVNNTIRYNRAPGNRGGGIYFLSAVAGLANTVVADNQAADGAGLYLRASSPMLFYTTIAQNSGNDGVHLAAQNYIPSMPTFTNTIVSSHTVGVYAEYNFLFQNQATLRGVLWWGNGNDTGGSGVVDPSNAVYGDPRFTCTADAPACLLPYHILTDSAALDSGLAASLSLSGMELSADIDGQLRPSGPGYDLGADEAKQETFSLLPPLSLRLAAPGQVLIHSHQLVNSSAQTDTYTLTVHSDSGWAWLASPTPLSVAGQSSVTVQVQVQVPATASIGANDVAIITATSWAVPQQRTYALDLTRVVTPDNPVPVLTVTQPISVPGLYIFGDTCAQVWFTQTGSLTALTVTLAYTYPTHQLDGRPLPRRYDITGDGSGFLAALGLCYADGELAMAGVVSETGLSLYRYPGSGAMWLPYTSLPDPAHNRVTATQVTTFSPWAIGLPGGHEPTAAGLRSLRTGGGAWRWLGVGVGLLLLAVTAWVRRKTT